MDVAAVAPKKSRAKSCSACRQVKLKCDVREKYPARCSRCVGRNLNCRMDPNFKRINTRGLSHTRSELSAIVQPSTTPQTLEIHDIEIQNTLHASLPDRSGGPFTNDLSLETWFDKQIHSSEQQLLPSYKLGDAIVDGGQIVDLFQQFEDLYYFHFPILEPLKSLNTLSKDSPALFWAIVITTCRFHPQHSYLHALLFEPFEQLLGSLFIQLVQNLKDLQALLLICQWPLQLHSRSDDPAWVHIGFVVNAALNMGLDNAQAEVLTNVHLEDTLSNIQSEKYRRKTWLKVFQISTHLAMWHGLRPPISSASELHQLLDFYEKETDRELIAGTEIQRQMVRNTTTLTEFGFRGPQPTILQSMIQELDYIKRQFADVWSVSLSSNLHAVKLYILEQCLILAADQLETATSDAEHFIAMALQMGHGPAISMIEIFTRQCAAGQVDPPCAPIKAGGSPLLSNPKHHSRVAFYACIFLIHYLDHMTIASSSDQDAARSAVAALHQVSMQFPSRGLLTRAGRTIEVIARSIVPGQRRLRPMVRSRMGGSLVFNALWLASQLRRREDPDDLTVSLPPLSASTASCEQDHSAAENCALDSMGPLSQQEIFPWGVWNDQLYDDLGFSWDGLGFQAFSGATDPF